MLIFVVAGTGMGEKREGLPVHDLSLPVVNAAANTEADDLITPDVDACWGNYHLDVARY